MATTMSQTLDLLAACAACAVVVVALAAAF